MTLDEGFLGTGQIISVTFLIAHELGNGSKYFCVSVASEGEWETVFLSGKKLWFTLYISMWLLPVILKTWVLETSDGKHPPSLIKWLSSLGAFCMRPRPAWSSHSNARVCLLWAAIRGQCRWLRRTEERLLIPWHVKTFCQANSASLRLGFWCVNRDCLITQVMSITATWVFSRN